MAKDMQIIGAGFMRTGTMSMQAALGILGHRCYHMQEVPRRPAHIDAWQRFMTGREEMDWQALFKGYTATVDAPAFWYYEALMREFPDAKVVLTVREPDRWYESFVTLHRALNRFPLVAKLIPRLGKFTLLANTVFATVFGDDLGRDNCVRVFNEHNRRLQALVPPERLLVFRVTDGWQPLCDFLGCPVPEGVPFPHLNRGDATLKTVARRIFIDPLLLRVALFGALVGGVAFALPV